MPEYIICITNINTIALKKRVEYLYLNDVDQSEKNKVRNMDTFKVQKMFLYKKATI